jgi:ammonium transporter, Amt family
MLASAALVLLMTPGLALFYGGMTRRKNVLGTIMQSFIAMGLITIIWVVVGYSLGFSESSGFLGGLKYLMLNGVGPNDPSPYFMAKGSATAGSPMYAETGTIPHQLYMVYQMMFAIITPALISGAFAERVKFSSYLVFIGLWCLVVYVPIAHWVWGADGWLYKMGALDFAGGTVVHISSGVSALVAALIIGKRKGYPNEEMRPHNLTMTLIGTGLLWFGWFGFNGGSALGADGLAVNAFVNTHVATATAMMAWTFVEWAHRGKPTALGAASGAVAGLVGITPAAGFVSIPGALAIGVVVALACYAAVMWKSKLGYDDSLDTFGVHGVGGTVGAIMTGLFAVKAMSGMGDDGTFFGGGTTQLMKQLTGVGATWVYAAVMTAILLFVINAVMGLRMKSTDEEAGMDIALHGEEGYVL